MNDQNLKTPTTSEARERGRLGGIASGQSRRERKAIRQALEEALSMPCELEGETMTNVEAIAAAMVKRAREGDVRAFVEVRNSVGEKPAERIEAMPIISEETYREVREILMGGFDDER